MYDPEALHGPRGFLSPCLPALTPSGAGIAEPASVKICKGKLTNG